MIIDAHTHLMSEPGYADRLVEAERAAGVDRFITFSAGPDGGWAGNDEILAAARRYPDMIIPFAYATLGQVTADRISEFADEGFRGFKFINPHLPYGDSFLFPVYARIEELGLPAYFHTGIVGCFGDEARFDTDTERHKIIHLDRVARKFPDLKIIAAHMGNPDYHEAAMMMRWHRNLHFDLSGSTLKKRGAAFFRELFWWGYDDSYERDDCERDPWEKILFGTDVGPSGVAAVKAEYESLLNGLDAPENVRRAVFGGNAARLLGGA